MLISLRLRHFATIETLELTPKAGLTVLTGETGAGKSIIIDALSLALGARADSSMVRAGQERAEVEASFCIRDNLKAQAWLKARELDEGLECTLRRTIRADGPSRAFINGRSMPAQECRELGAMLVNIHSQHEQQALLHQQNQQQLLDSYAQAHNLSERVANAWRLWQKARRQHDAARQSANEQIERQALLEFQLEELNTLDIQAGEVEELESLQKRLGNNDYLLRTSQQCISNLIDGHEGPSAMDLMGQSLSQLQKASEQDIALHNIAQTLESALLQVEAAGDDLRHYLSTLEEDPAQLQATEERLSNVYQLARRHRIRPEELHLLHQELIDQAQVLGSFDEHLEALAQEEQQAEQQYLELAQQLSELRRKKTLPLAKGVERHLHELGLPNARFQIELSAQAPAISGLESIEFVFSANPGQPLRPLAKVASGGELSRVSLAIQVICAQVLTVPCLIFDEVDVGIGGGVAEIVGRLLRELSKHAQLLCITHQPQVASQGLQHWHVRKKQSQKTTFSYVDTLEGENRITEIARMLGGLELTQSTLAHAEEMLSLSQAG